MRCRRAPPRVPPARLPLRRRRSRARQIVRGEPRAGAWGRGGFERDAPPDRIAFHHANPQLVAHAVTAAALPHAQAVMFLVQLDGVAELLLGNEAFHVDLLQLAEE